MPAAVVIVPMDTVAVSSRQSSLQPSAVHPGDPFQAKSHPVEVTRTGLGAPCPPGLCCDTSTAACRSDPWLRGAGQAWAALL